MKAITKNRIPDTALVNKVVKPTIANKTPNIQPTTKPKVIFLVLTSTDSFLFSILLDRT